MYTHITYMYEFIISICNYIVIYRLMKINACPREADGSIHCKNYSATMSFSADLQWAGTLYLNWDLKGQSHENQG